jgi:adenylate kinase family enzyme
MENIVENNISIPPQIIIIQKTPEYTKRAQRAHYNRNKDNEEFMKKKLEQSRKWREENKDAYNESQKLIMRERRAKKKIEKENSERLINENLNIT